MVKKRGVVWNYYNKKVEGTTVSAFCHFCERSYIQNATRMEKHLARCEKAPPDVKQLFLRVSTSKRVNRARLLGAKMTGNWLKQSNEMGLDVTTMTEADLEDIKEWNRQKNDMPNENAAVESIILADGGEYEATWINQDEEEDTPAKKVNEAVKSAKIWIKQSHAVENVVGAQNSSDVDPLRSNKTAQKKPESENGANSHSMVSLSPHTNNGVGHSPLQTKILQEQLLEKRALRKIAELELRRKTLEIERYEWEYERDKAQADIRWEHETRMMEIKEERERKFVQSQDSSYLSK